MVSSPCRHGCILLLLSLSFVAVVPALKINGDDTQQVDLATNGSGIPGDDIRNCTPPASDNFPDDGISMATKRNGGVLLHIFIAFYAFGALAVVCNYYFLSSMEAICRRFGLSEDVAGATFMAIGTSAPELGTAFIGVFITESNVGLDTVAGSTVFNMFFITSLCGLFGLHVIAIKRWPVIRDLSFFVIAAIVLIAATLDGVVTWYEGLLVTSVYVVYIMVMAFSQRIQRAIDRCWERRYGNSEETISLLTDERRPRQPSRLSTRSYYVDDEGEDPYLERAESTEEVSMVSSGYRSDLEDSLTAARIKFGQSIMSLGGNEETDDYQTQLVWPKGRISQFFWILYLPVSILLFLTVPDCNRPGCWRNLYILTFISSVVWVSGLAYLLVWMVEIIGEVFFIPESVMGITFLAIGTSLPDAIASLLACRKGLGDMAIANIFGSNILDLVCTGLPWFLRTAVVYPGTLVTTGTASVVFTIISLLSCSFVVLVAFLIIRWTLDRRIGVTFMVLYIMYLVICILYELNFFGFVNLPVCPENEVHT